MKRRVTQWEGKANEGRFVPLTGFNGGSFYAEGRGRSRIGREDYLNVSSRAFDWTVVGASPYES